MMAMIVLLAGSTEKALRNTIDAYRQLGRNVTPLSGFREGATAHLEPADAGVRQSGCSIDKLGGGALHTILVEIV
jgi:hypothetical protein